MRRIVLILGVALLVGLLPAGAQAAGTRSAINLTISGAGWGHGIGMSQFGAYGFALHLKDYQYILSHYYRGTTLGVLSSSPEIRVLLQDERSRIRVSGALRSGDKTLDASKTYTIRRSGADIVLADGDADLFSTQSALRLDPPVGQPLRLHGTSTPGVVDGLYRGGIVISPSGSGLRAVNAVNLEDYVRGVVSAESPPSWPAEALKAQAVAARTYAITTGGGPAFDQYADTRSQVYRGVAAETPSTDAAVAATAGQVVLYDGKPAVTFFFSTSGGQTENVENSFVGSEPRPWLTSVKDPYDNLSPKHRWGPMRFTELQARKRLKGIVQGSFRQIRVLRRGESPRIVRAQVIGSKGKVNVSGAQLRAAFGLNDTWAYFRSISTKARRAKGTTKKSPNSSAPTTKTTTPAAAPQAPAVESTGGVAAAARAAATARHVLEGKIAPATKGTRLTVQRREGTKWVTVRQARVRANGSYAVQVQGAGKYRIVYRDAVGPTITID